MRNRGSWSAEGAFSRVGVRRWPQTVKPRGTVADVAGFTKESGWWLRVWWLSRIHGSDAGRPPLPDTRTAYIVDGWQAGRMVNGSALPRQRLVHVYTDAAWLRLELNGKQVAPPTAVPPFGNAEFRVSFAPGNLTAVALDARLRTLSVATVLTHGEAAAIRLLLDAPSPYSGTGEALVADGEDTAMVRAEVIDADGNLVSSSSAEAPADQALVTSRVE